MTPRPALSGDNPAAGRWSFPGTEAVTAYAPVLAAVQSLFSSTCSLAWITIRAKLSANAERLCATNSHVRPRTLAARHNARSSQAASNYRSSFPETEEVSRCGGDDDQFDRPPGHARRRGTWIKSCSMPGPRALACRFRCTWWIIDGCRVVTRRCDGGHAPVLRPGRLTSQLR